MLLPRTVRILNGMTMILPPHMVNRQFGVSMEGAYTGSLEAALTASVMGHPSISGFAPSSDDINPEALETIAKYMDAYKTHIRPMHESMKVYHHTPVLPGTEGEGRCVLEYATENRSSGVVGIWRQYAAREASMKLRLRGVDLGARYLVCVLPSEDTFEMSGADLSYNGLDIRLDSSLTSQLLLLKKL